MIKSGLVLAVFVLLLGCSVAMVAAHVVTTTAGVAVGVMDTVIPDITNKYL